MHCINVLRLVLILLIKENTLSDWLIVLSNVPVQDQLWKLLGSPNRTNVREWRVRKEEVGILFRGNKLPAEQFHLFHIMKVSACSCFFCLRFAMFLITPGIAVAAEQWFVGQAKTLKKFMLLGLIYYNRGLSRQYLIWLSDCESLQPTTTKL